MTKIDSHFIFYKMAGGRDLSDQGPYVHAAGMPLRGSNHD